MSVRTTVTWVLVFTCFGVVIPVRAAEVALVPVGASGPHVIVGNEITLYGPGQRVTLEIYASQWQPARLKHYQAVIDPSGYVSGLAGQLHPVGWVGLAEEAPCVVDGDCPLGHWCWSYEDSSELGLCALPGHDPELGAFIDEGHHRFVFAGLPVIKAVDLSVFGYRYGAVTIDYPSAPEYVPPPRYCGTLLLDASSEAMGTFTVELQDGGDHTFLVDDENHFVPDVMLTPALITVLPAECGNGICDSGEDEASCPEDCLAPPIPAASTWGLAVLGLLLAALAKVYFTRHRRAESV
jgi:hypothetical protein